MATTLCYNRGCGKQYIPRENPDGCCQFHPGAPFFHEGYKGWTCCNKKTTDFTEFLNTPGCIKGIFLTISLSIFKVSKCIKSTKNHTTILIQ